MFLAFIDIEVHVQMYMYNSRCRALIICLECFNIIIMRTCLYSFDPLKPHFYTVKLGFMGVNIIFLVSTQTHSCGYSLEPPRRGGSNEYPQSMF